MKRTLCWLWFVVSFSVSSFAYAGPDICGTWRFSSEHRGFDFNRVAINAGRGSDYFVMRPSPECLETVIEIEKALDGEHELVATFRAGNRKVTLFCATETKKGKGEPPICCKSQGAFAFNIRRISGRHAKLTFTGSYYHHFSSSRNPEPYKFYYPYVTSEFIDAMVRHQGVRDGYSHRERIDDCDCIRRNFIEGIGWQSEWDLEVANY